MLASGNAARISQKYGCAQDIHNTGTYTMQGSTIIAAGQGLYKGKRIAKLRSYSSMNDLRSPVKCLALRAPAPVHSTPRGRKPRNR